MKRLSATSLTIALAGFLLTPFAQAATCIPTTNDGMGLQACLTSTAPGDTILLKQGTYIPTTPLVFPGPAGRAFFISKPLTIRGKGPGVVLSGNVGGGAHAFNVVIINAGANPGMVTLENLTIEGGDSRAGGYYVGGAIVTGTNQTVTLNNVTIQDNAAVHGGGLWLGNGGTWTINNSRFLNNLASDSGGAVGAAGASLLDVRGGLFDGNTANGFAGGAIRFNSFGSLKVTGTTFSNNTVGESGGAISIQGVTIFNSYTIEDCVFRSNRAIAAEGFGGALDIFSIINQGSVTNSTFQYNSASLSGGAVYITHGYSTLINNRFLENQAVYGGAVGIQGGEAHGARNTNITFESNTLEDNTGALGGAMLAFDVFNPTTEPGDERFSGLTFSKNQYRRNHATVVGGAVLISSAENVSIDKDHFTANWSDGAIGGLGLLDVTSGELSKLHFNQNGANDIPDSLYIEASPILVTTGVQVAGQHANDCVIEGVVGCP